MTMWKGQEIDPPAVGRHLGVRMLLSGKVIERGGRLSVQAELVDAVANKQLWGERLHRPLADIFEVEEEIARQIVDKLRLRLSGEEKEHLARRYTDNSEAYDLYLKARYHFLKRTPAAMEKAIEYCELAIAKDRGFALAYAALTDCWLVMRAMSSSPTREMLDKAKTAALRAVDADDTLAEAHNSLAYVYAICDWDWIESERSFQRALELNPASWMTHDWYSLGLSCQGRLDEAIARNRRAQELEPLSIVLHHHAAWLLWLARRFDEALEQCAKALELDPNFGWAFLWRGLAYEQKTMYEESIDALQTAVKFTGAMPLAAASLTHALATAGRRDESEASGRQLEARSANGYLEPYAMALVSAGFNQTDSMFQWLERAYKDRSSWIVLFLKSDPRLDPFRPDPRYRDLLRRMRLSE